MREQVPFRDPHAGPGSMSTMSAQESPLWGRASSISAAAQPPYVVPSHTLFDSTSIGIATFLGSPVAGAWLMALNYHRLGKRNQALAAFAGGMAVTGLGIGLGYLIPATYSSAIAIGLVAIMKNVSKALQDAAVEQHMREGGQPGSRLIAAGTGLASLLVLGGIIFALLQVGLGSKVVVGSKDQIYYSGSATKDDAKHLGEELKTSGFFADRGASVLLSKGKDGTAVTFLTEDGVWDRPDMVVAFEEVGREIAPAVGGFPVKVRLANTERQTMKELAVGKAATGTKDDLYYFGSATESDARALVQLLKSAGFFQDQGATVMFSKNDDGTAISYVVAEGSWDRPISVAAFEALTRAVASSVGGFPLKLRLLSSRLEEKKVVAIN
jgi:hypothetical protein